MSAGRPGTGSALLDDVGAVISRAPGAAPVGGGSLRRSRHVARPALWRLARVIAPLSALVIAALGGVLAGVQWQARQQPNLADLRLQAQWQAMATQHAVAREPRTAAGQAVDLPTGCRSGAFVEASGILGSVAQIADTLPAATAERTRAELDTVLFTALKQARAEVHCVAGGLSHGYDRAYAQTIERATRLAHQRGLHADVVRTGDETVAALRANRVVAAR